jgi:anti-anti-sigma factor
MKAYTDTDNNALHLVPESDLVASRVEEIRNFFMSQLKAHQGETTIILDAQGIEVVDSLGVNLIIGLYKHAFSESKTFQVLNAGDKFMKVANFFRFSSIFTIESR